jgi:hypothetical protein
MTPKHRWMKFWPQDWHRDPALRCCGAAARGMWIDMICLMHEGTPYGHLTINGKPATMRQIGAITGVGEEQATELTAELEEAGVFSRTRNRTIYSRRMVRDATKSADGAEDIVKRWGEGESSGTTRARRLSAARKKGTHTPAEWQALLDITGELCPRCNKGPAENGGGFIKDHITPIYKGGSDGVDNIQPLCQPCNASKGPESIDFRPLDWREKLKKRLGKSLGSGKKTPTLESESESESERLTQHAPRVVQTACDAGAEIISPDHPDDCRTHPKPVTTSKRGTRLPPDWAPNDGLIDFCRQLGVDPVRAAEEFSDYWPTVAGPKGVKLDWNLTFKNRCRELAERGRFPLSAGRPATSARPIRLVSRISGSW